MSRGPAPGNYWSLPAKRPPPAASIVADRIGVTFPVRGRVAKELDQQAASRMIWDEEGRLRGVRAIDDVSFSLRRGNRMAIIGENGSGKTTLLQVLAGIMAPETGRLAIRGRITNLININLGTQPEATGHQNITFRGLAAGYKHAEIEEKRQEIAEFSELGEFLDMPIETYSAGMRMRLVFSIATAFTPEILILDEWLSAGDLSFKEKATRRMNEFVEKAGILILASHSRKLILDNCETALWMEQGRVRAMGPVLEIVDAYEDAQKQKKSPPPPALRLAVSH
ncbi:MAG: ABC transporter ATP-binding protein [Hyphomonas sp.]|nr:ABC transporter ATP-binding protein [Hyphomonas sp.]